MPVSEVLQQIRKAKQLEYTQLALPNLFPQKRMKLLTLLLPVSMLFVGP